jgi:hypothetical protein
MTAARVFSLHLKTRVLLRNGEESLVKYSNHRILTSLQGFLGNARPKTATPAKKTRKTPQWKRYTTALVTVAILGGIYEGGETRGNDPANVTVNVTVNN